MNKLVQISMVVLIATLAVFAQVPTNGLVAFFPFSGDYKDACGNITLDTAKAGAPILVADRNGTANSAYKFNGTNTILKGLVTDKLPSGSSDVTISAWVLDSSSQFTRVITSWGTDTLRQSKQIVLYLSSKNQRNNVGITNGVDSVFQEIKPYNVLLNWMHVAVTIKSGSYKIFINGKSVTSNSMTFNIQSGGVLGIATNMRTQLTGVDNFGGHVDDIAIYNRALADQEVSYLYTCKSTKNSAPMITSIPITAVKALEDYTYNVTTSDVDSQTVTLSLLNKPNGMTLTGNKIIWAPTNDNAGKNAVTIVAKDVLGDSVSQSFEINVEPVTGITHDIILHKITPNSQVGAFYLPNGRVCQSLPRGLVVSQHMKRIMIR